MKNFKGKAIYQPAGKAAEYAKWACNFYTGCSNGCTYCYLKKGRGAKILGGDKPTLKKCFKDAKHALEVFENELQANLPELQKHGLFFTFTTDPFLPETSALCTYAAGIAAHRYGVPVKFLTKVTKDWVDDFLHHIDHSNSINAAKEWRKMFAYGFTLTGHDELEPGASTNQERIEAMKKLHDAGFKTFASIEPIIDFTASMDMIDQSIGFCDLYKIGLMSGQKSDPFFRESLNMFIKAVCNRTVLNGFNVYFKDSLLKVAIIDRSELPANCVSRDYNIFNQ